MTDVLVSLHDLEAGYTAPRQAPRVVVGPVSLSMRRGELVCLLGPNGAGKSTLMRTLAGMQQPIRGTVEIAGVDLRQLSPLELARRLSVVLTERVAGGMLSVYDLVALGRHPFTDWTGRLTERDHAAIERAIRAVGASALASRRVAELSDGERQKAMVARALAQEPEVMVLDEITAFLDLPRRVEVMHVLRRLAHDEGRSILLSTHDLDLALRTADTLWIVHGTTISSGMPEELVLAGTFDTAFAADGLWFDREHGSFRFSLRSRGTACIEGASLAGWWTKRALERQGYEIVEGGAPLSIRVLGPPDAPTWTVVQDGQESSHASLRAALAALRQARHDG